jgi:hypothetical protein
MYLHIKKRALSSVLPLPVGTGRPRPPLSKKSIDFDHEIMNLIEKNVGTPAILGRALIISTSETFRPS